MNESTRPTASEALQLLIDGNRRFSRGLTSGEPLLSTLRLKELADKGQSPFAVILTCSDSRIPTELLFDRGVGDLFVIRVAGNVVTPSLIASVEFAAESFETPLCVIMGHTQCGAITAAFNHVRTGGTSQSSYLDRLVRRIAPAVKAVAPEGGVDDPATFRAATEENVKRSLLSLKRRSKLIKKRTETGKLALVGALFDLHTGMVQFDPVDLSEAAQQGQGEPAGSLGDDDQSIGKGRRGNGEPGQGFKRASREVRARMAY